MPHNLARSVPVGVFPKMTYLSFTETRIYPMLVQNYHDATIERALIVDTVNPAQSIHTWKLTARLSCQQVTALRTFYESHLGGTIPFYFYAPFEVAPGMPIGSNWSAEASTFEGLYAARFTTPAWNTVTDVGLTNVSLDLQEVDYE